MKLFQVEAEVHLRVGRDGPACGSQKRGSTPVGGTNGNRFAPKLEERRVRGPQVHPPSFPATHIRTDHRTSCRMSRFSSGVASSERHDSAIREVLDFRSCKAEFAKDGVGVFS